MSFISDLSDLMTDTVTWSPMTSRDDYGQPSYGSATVLDARVVRKNKLVRDSQGQQVMSTAHAWVNGSPAIKPEDKVVLSDSSNNPIVSIERYQDEKGPSHTVVFFL